MGKWAEQVAAPACWRCEANCYYHETVSKYQNGVMMHTGDRFCLGGKHARKFRSRDPKHKPPTWCPKRKTPCELRVYSFISNEAYIMHILFARIEKLSAEPSDYRYGLRYEGSTELTPQEFWKESHQGIGRPALPVTVGLYDVVEIDDGLEPVCFYLSDTGYRIAPFFRTVEARARTAKQTES